MKAIHSDGLFRDWLGDLTDTHLRSIRSIAGSMPAQAPRVLTPLSSATSSTSAGRCAKIPTVMTPGI